MKDQPASLHASEKWRLNCSEFLRSRWWVLVLLTLCISINFIDRQSFSVLEPVLHRELHFNNTEYSIMVVSFLLGMALMQLPVGWLFDSLGPKRTFLLIVAGWSIANGLHALARNLGQFSGLRFVLGGFECGSYSGGMKVISQWFPTEERALAGGIFNSGTLLGPVIAPPLVVWLTLHYSWHVAFLATSTLGLFWLLLWQKTHHSSNNPLLAASSSDPSTQEKRVGIRRLLRCRQAWGVFLIRAFSGPFSNFYWYWLPAYLYRRGLSFRLIGFLAWIPYFGGAIGNIGGGWLASVLLRRGLSLDATRKTCFVVGGALAASSAAIPLLPSSGWAVAAICLSIFGSNIIEANYIGVVTDVFPEEVVGRLTGFTGIGDNTMSMILMFATGVVVDRLSYFPVFLAVGLIPIGEVLALFLVVRTIERVRLV